MREYKKSLIYIYYPRNFANEYSLIEIKTSEEKERIEKWYLENGNTGDDLHRITRKTMKELISDEKHRRKTDCNFSGYCDIELQSFEDFTYRLEV